MEICTGKNNQYLQIKALLSKTLFRAASNQNALAQFTVKQYNFTSIKFLKCCTFAHSPGFYFHEYAKLYM